MSFIAHNNSEYIKYNKLDLKKLQKQITKNIQRIFGNIKGTVKRLNEYAILQNIGNGRKPSLSSFWRSMNIWKIIILKATIFYWL
ncbi:MAG: hypothetical protein ACXW0J_06275 [Nitrososphaeraceae archaeon]